MRPTNFSVIAQCFALEPKTLFQWYKNYLSDYHQDKQEGKFAANKVYVVDKNTGEIKKEQIVHILEPENRGDTLCVDEKMMDHRYTTILTNYKIGKIILLIDTIKPALLRAC